MMHRLRRYDVFRFAQNDVARFTRNDAMFAPMCRQAHIIREAVIIGEANIICRRQKCKSNPSISAKRVYIDTRSCRNG